LRKSHASGKDRLAANYILNAPHFRPCITLWLNYKKLWHAADQPWLTLANVFRAFHEENLCPCWI
jgi:hypothetical protein